MKLPFLAMILGASTLKVGDKAPDFTLTDSDGKPVALGALLQKGPVILAFFPKAFTPGCTKENQAYRDRYAEVEKKGASVVAISTDSPDTLKKFKDEYHLPFLLLSDADGKVADQYGGRIPVVGLANRATYVVDQDGKIADIVTGSAAVDPTASLTSCPAKKG